MITEKGLVLRHNAFWHRLLPMAPAYVRALNLSTTAFAEPIPEAGPGNRGVVNELAFRLFAAALTESCEPAELSPAVILSKTEECVNFIRRFRQFNREPVEFPSSDALSEAQLLASNIKRYFVSQHNEPPVIWPTFAGCGIVDECCGDALTGQMLVEIKSNSGLFRGRDVRQILCYAALNFAKKQCDLRQFCLVNPRRGIFFVDSVEHLCEQTAGASANEVLSDIVEYVSEPFAKTDTS